MEDMERCGVMSSRAQFTCMGIVSLKEACQVSACLPLRCASACYEFTSQVYQANLATKFYRYLQKYKYNYSSGLTKGAQKLTDLKLRSFIQATFVYLLLSSQERQQSEVSLERIMNTAFNANNVSGLMGVKSTSPGPITPLQKRLSGRHVMFFNFTLP